MKSPEKNRPRIDVLSVVSVINVDLTDGGKSRDLISSIAT